MSINNIKFTTKGRNLHAKAQAGATLTFTKISMGDGDNGGASSDAYDNLLNPIHSLNITKLKSTGDSSAIIGGIFNNSGLAAFYFREIGLFATDPDLGEILYCYGNAGANAEYIPEGGGSTILERQLNVIATVGNATSVNANIDYSMYSTMEFVKDEITAHDVSGVSHADIRTKLNDLGKSSLTNLGHVTTGTCAGFIQSKISEGYKTGLFVATALSDMPEGGLVVYYSSINVTGAVTVELHSQYNDYLARINNTTGAYLVAWKKLATDYIADNLATVEKLPSEYPVGMTMEYTGERSVDGTNWVELLTYRGSTVGECIQYAFTYRYGTTKDILRYRTSANSAGSAWGAWKKILNDDHSSEVVSYQSYASRDLSLAGEQVISLISGRYAKELVIYANVNGNIQMSIGVATSNRQSVLAQIDSGNTTLVLDNMIYIRQSSGNIMQGIVTIELGQIKITWTKTGTTSGTVQLMVNAKYHD